MLPLLDHIDDPDNDVTTESSHNEAAKPEDVDVDDDLAGAKARNGKDRGYVPAIDPARA